MKQGKTRSVLLAMESQSAMRELCDLIEWAKFGYDIAGQVFNGVQAIEMAAKLQPDILILDVHLSGYNGIEVLRRVRAFRPQLPVILISNFAEFTYAQQALRYGAQDFLVRPIEQADLLHCLQRIELPGSPLRAVSAAGLESRAAAWAARLSRSAKFADDIRKMVVCSHTFLRLEKEGQCRLLQDGPQWIWVAAIPEKSDAAFFQQLEAQHVRIGLSHGFFQCQDLKEALRQAQTAASPFWGQELFVVQERSDMNYEAVRLFSQLWGLLHQCAIRQYSWHQFWAMYDILLTTLQTLRVDFTQTMIIYNSLVTMARSIYEGAGMSLEFLALDAIDSQAAQGHTLNQRLMDIRRDLQKSLKEGRFDPSNHPAGELTDEILTYLNTHFCDADISVESVAAKFFISPAYFGQTFKRTYGISITEHINRKRMDYAEYLLTHEDLSIKDVSRRVGIPDQYYFSKLFKKYKQITPGDAKKLRQQEPNV